MIQNYHEQNRKSWNNATKKHHSHKPDLIERYQNGWNNLYREDMELLGDVKDKTLAHLQCNDGQDTISIAKFCGAQVTGIDISDYAIEFAQKLSAETGISADFVRSDIFEWFDNNETMYDVVYTSYGTVNWISDIKRWAKGIAKTLKSGGKFVMIDFHPLIGMFETDWSLKYDYMDGKVDESGGVGDYVGDDWEGNFQNQQTAYEFAWGIGNILGGLLESGLILEHFKEYPYINGWQRFPEMETTAESRHYPPKDKPTMAMMYSIIARKAE
jgi:SAM-dependent methyltransferase